ncbi:tryptophan 7-halogenase [Alteraurantiacibacter aestuarii]|uniref:Tryptophan 7-halogenase n=1 Tax=Alteraurantiacibacter aestuarii TaxID=650004 RepID=A0A844ZRI8_9SPHN|nr:tryptophan 7-halogenase [Alteraurantiacibacter aestuarii]MXO88219.1 hypothetical protein [Alteraurantiacibacter aestuarii]
MSEARERLRRIAIAGGGQLGILTAIALRRALPDAQVVVIGLPPDPAGFADRASTALPFTNRLHDRLKIDETQLVQRAGGSHRLVTRYFGWGDEDQVGEKQNGAMAYGATLDPQLRTRFAQEWGGGRSAGGGASPPGSLAEVLADAGRFAVPPGDVSTPIDQVDYALRWNMPAYREMLIAMAQQLGAQHVAGTMEALQPDGAGGLAAIAIAGQGLIEADLFIDCSGTQAHLLSALPEAKRQDWSAMLPVRRVLHAIPGEPMLALEDRFSLLPEGWLCEFAGRDGLQVTLALADGVSEDAALRALGAGPAGLVQMEPGCAQLPWCGNVIALGDAAASFEPLGFLNLDLAHRQLALLLEMLPGRTIEPLERAEYNRRALLMAQQVRDTLAVHYASPRARQVFGACELPPSLEAALDQFARRGRLPFRDEPALLVQEYMALLRALGFAEGTTPQSRSADQRSVEASRQAFAAQARAALEFTPPYQQFMQQALQPQPVASDLQY